MKINRTPTGNKSIRLHDAFTGYARQRHDLTGGSETRTVSAQSVRALRTLLSVFRTPFRELQFSSRVVIDFCVRVAVSFIF